MEKKNLRQTSLIGLTTLAIARSAKQSSNASWTRNSQTNGGERGVPLLQGKSKKRAGDKHYNLGFY